MGVLPTPNHLALIRDCYPPHNNKSSSSPDGAELPRPVSNAVSKLAFYAVNRPAKLPKVVGVLADRASKARGTSGGHVKNREELAVTCDILRTLVLECAESGNQGSAELVKSALAEPALSVAELALGGTPQQPGDSRLANGTHATRSDPELEARGASLFHSVATMVTPPFFGFGASAHRYQRCLAILAARVQPGSPSSSSYIAAKGLEGAARSDVMFATGSDFDRQVGELGPAFFSLCLTRSATDLETEILDSDTLAPLPSSLRSRKSPMISPPSSSSSPPSDAAVRGLAHLSRHSTVPQLLGLQSALLAFLEQHSSAPLGNDGAASPGTALARILTTAAPESHRSPAMSWWADRAAESQQPARTVALLGILQELIEGLSRQRDTPTAGTASLNANGILATLEEMLVQASGASALGPGDIGANDFGSTSGSDPVTSAIFTTIRTLVQTVEKSGYPNQLDDLASGTIAHIRTLSDLSDSADPELQQSYNVDSLSKTRSGQQDTRLARSRLLSVLHLFVDPSTSEALLSRGETDAQPQPSTVISTSAMPPISPAPPSDSAVTPRLSDNARPALLAQETVTSLASAATITVPGMVLGAPVHTGAPVASSSAATEGNARAPTIDTSPLADSEQSQPVVLVHPPTTRPDTHAFPGTPSGSTDLHLRKTLSPFTMSQSLFLLHDPDTVIQTQYATILATFLQQMAMRPDSVGKTAESEAFWNRFAVAYHDFLRTLETNPQSVPSSEAPSAVEQKLAASAFETRSIPALVACAPMLFSLTSDGTNQASSSWASVRNRGIDALDQLGRTWGVEGLGQKSISSQEQAVDALVGAVEHQLGSQTVDSSSIRQLLLKPWNQQAAKLTTSSTLSPYLSGAPPARSLVQLGVSRSRANSALRLTASAPRTPPSLVHSGPASSAGGHHSASPPNGIVLLTGGESAAASIAPSTTTTSAFARRRMQTPSLADLQHAATRSSGSVPPAGDGSPARSVAASIAASSLAGTAQGVSAVGSVAGSTATTAGGSSRRRTGRQSVESVLERVGRRINMSS